MVWSPSCDSVGVHVKLPLSVMAAPDGNVPSNENIKASSSDAVVSKGELYKFVHSLVTDRYLASEPH